jgi:hypothetical protein
MGERPLIFSAADMFNYTVTEDQVEVVVGELSEVGCVTFYEAKVMTCRSGSFNFHPGQVDDCDLKRRLDEIPDLSRASQVYHPVARLQM